MPEPIRVLHVIRLMNHGGVESMIMNLYRNIDRSKVQFDFVQNSNEPAVYDEEILSLGGKIYRCPHYNGKNHFAYTGWWNNFFKAHPGEYAIVHGHLGSTAAIYLSIAKKYGCYAIAHSHSAGAGSLGFRLFSYPTRFVADHFFACSREAGIARFGKKVGTDAEMCQVLNNAIDTNRFAFCEEARNEMWRKLKIPPEAIVLGHLGRFRTEKNHLFLLDIFAEFLRSQPDAMLLLVGDGELRGQIENKIMEKQLQNKVILAGARSNTWDYYNVMDVFVMPSLYEGVPVSLVEAQASGLPCVVSSVVPQEAAITDSVRFISLDAGAQLWADVVEKEASSPRRNVLTQLKEAGYDIVKTAKWLEEYYRKVAQHE